MSFLLTVRPTIKSNSLVKPSPYKVELTRYHYIS